MDNIDTPTTDIVITDEAVVVENSATASFGKEITKTLVVSTASSVGVLAGFVVVGYAVGKIQQFKAKRASAKETVIVEGEVVDLPVTETPKTEK